MAYNREVLQSFFVEDEAVVAVLILQVFHRYSADVGVSQAGQLIVEVCRVYVHLFAS